MKKCVSRRRVILNSIFLFFTLFEPIAIVENLPKNQNLFPKTTNYLLKTMQRYGLFRKQQWIANGFWKKNAFFLMQINRLCANTINLCPNTPKNQP